MNLAVNNLLSRDDEEGEDVDDGQDSYVPGGKFFNNSRIGQKPMWFCLSHEYSFSTADDLISLLDAGIHGAAGSDHPSVIIDADTMFSEDMFGYSTLRSRSSGRSRAGNCMNCFVF